LDGHALAMSWFIYREAGTFPGETTSLVAPSLDRKFRAPQPIHMILQVQDDDAQRVLVSPRRDNHVAANSKVCLMKCAALLGAKSLRLGSNLDMALLSRKNSPG
jgi:hypothetical protein